MISRPRYEGDGTTACPVCDGMRHIYPVSLLCAGGSDQTKHMGLNGLECPNCGGLGEIKGQRFIS